MKYAIQCDYYLWDDEKDEEYTQWLYLGLEGAARIFVFDNQVVKRTKLFNTASEAGQYVDKHFNPNEQRAFCNNVRIVEVETQEG